MSYKLLRILPILFAPIATNARFTTLDYQGYAMSVGDQLTGSITFSGSGANANVTAFQFGVSDGTSLGFGPLPSIVLTTVNGSVNGAVGWDYPVIGGSYIFDTSFSIGPQRDYFSNAQYGGPQGQCNPYCGIVESNATPGVWEVVRVPELDATSSVTGLSLLFGVVAVLRGRRKLAS
jgi:hypothetical protein